MSEALKQELKDSVEDIINTLKKYYENKEWKYLVDNAIDITIEKYTQDNTLSGFSVLLVLGNPFIEWILHRGVSYIYATWGDIEIFQPVDIDIAYEFLEFLNETVKF
jgi:lipoate-protein ligase A